MAVVAASFVARSVFRSSSVRSTATRFCSQGLSIVNGFSLSDKNRSTMEIQRHKPINTGSLPEPEFSFTLSKVALAQIYKLVGFKEAQSSALNTDIATRNPLAHRIFRCPAEMSSCVGSMLPYHSATASALMTSMLTVFRWGYGWLPEDI
ncbi:unnamed protein product [Fraxinus pennsylvanica]|uniref:Uncharacterized protein n=1 Tax=Fraxinus pennsylvanica TaxID=56036 RepID=A0AAD1Z1Z1_9LAMI|nr:unnamed protein product [Fraxinus pennsylvanica]